LAEWTVPNTGLQQFRRDNPKFENKIGVQAEKLASLRNHNILFFHMIWLPELFPVSDLWHLLCNGRLTSSKFGELSTAVHLLIPGG